MLWHRRLTLLRWFGHGRISLRHVGHLDRPLTPLQPCGRQRCGPPVWSRLATKSASMFQYLDACGQFGLYILSLEKQALVHLFSTADRPCSQQVGSGASARAVTTSSVLLERLHKVLDPLAMDMRRRAGDACRPAAGTRPSSVAFDQMHDGARPVQQAHRRSPSPGNPPPVPRSTQYLRVRRERQKLERVGDMPRPHAAGGSTARSDCASAAIAAAARRSDRAAPLFHVKPA